MSVLNVVFRKPQFFECDRFNCRMLKKRCLERQKAAFDFYRAHVSHYEECKDCPQGEQIKQETEEPMPAPHPVEGEGTKALKCAAYSGCLGLAAKKNWKKFNCDECEYNEADSLEEIDLDDPSGEQPGPDELDDLELNDESPESTGTGEEVKLCKECGERPPIKPNHPYCAQCMAERSKKKAAESRSKGSGQKTSTNAKARPRKAPQGQDQALTIDFSKYTSILSEVEKLADEEMRPVEMQVIYMLRKSLDNQKMEAGS